MQAKLTVGAPNDVYEQEADRVAQQVTSMPDSAVQPTLQRQEDGDEALQTKPLVASITPLVQRQIQSADEALQEKSPEETFEPEEVAAEETGGEEIQAKSLDHPIQREGASEGEGDLDDDEVV